ncbi:hypothetical protein LV716_12485 [Flagellimonas sp. HMM57]|uniref:hypothetical protein n=1 Tax=unclassified Flagellimonas TaxID=2644544 RepID=UPI0013D44E4B|nr:MULTISPECIES: hypothetical protein [unclassified Flagellimonas]UII75071.1 hypothetical protein LV716_12485 [Flagellimonas sp. HMM57]
MGEFFKAELKDRFLKYAISRRDYFEVKVLYDEFLHPNYSLDFVEKLIKDIRDHDAALLDVMSGNGVEVFILASTPKTKDFLNEGGFMDMHIKEEEKWDVFLNQLSGDRKLSKDEKLLLEKNSKTFKREKTLLIVLVSAVVISFLFTLFSVIKGVLIETDYVQKEEFEREMRQLRSKYIEENQSLEKELQRAQATMDSLRGKNL